MSETQQLNDKIARKIRNFGNHPDKLVRSAAEIWAVEHSGLEAALLEVERLRKLLSAMQDALKARGLFAFEHVDGTYTINDR